MTVRDDDAYRVRVTVRNNKILSAIESMGFVGHGCMANFARFAGMSPNDVSALVAMRTPPINSEGEFTKTARQLMEVLGAAPSDLWTDTQLNTRLNRNTGEFSIDERALHAMIEHRDNVMTLPDPLDIAERNSIRDAVQKVLNGGRHNKRKIAMLCARFGIANTGGEKSLDEVGKMFDVTRDRIRQVEAQLTRRLRNDPKMQDIAGLDEQ